MGTFLTCLHSDYFFRLSRFGPDGGTFSRLYYRYNFLKIYSDVEKLYGDFSKQNAEFTEAFRYYSYYFPTKPIPKVVTIISGFSYRLFVIRRHWEWGSICT
jgi:hypothetical protein